MNLRNVAIWLGVVFVLIMAYSVLRQGGPTGRAGEISYSQLLKNIDAGQVKSAEINGQQVKVTAPDGKTTNVNAPPNSEDLIKRLEARNAEIKIQDGGRFSLVNLLLNMLPILLLIGVWIFFMSRCKAAPRARWALASPRPAC